MQLVPQVCPEFLRGVRRCQEVHVQSIFRILKALVDLGLIPNFLEERIAKYVHQRCSFSVLQIGNLAIELVDVLGTCDEVLGRLLHLALVVCVDVADFLRSTVRDDDPPCRP